MHAYLSELSKRVARYDTEMSHEQYVAAMEGADQHGELSPAQEWVGCKGSQVRCIVFNYSLNFSLLSYIPEVMLTI